MNKQDFSTAKVGDKLWSIQLGECEVYKITTENIYCENKTNKTDHDWNISGYNYESDLVPSLFWSNPNIQIPERPKRKVTKTVEAWANIYPDGEYYIYERELDAKHGRANKIAVVKLTGTYEVEE